MQPSEIENLYYYEFHYYLKNLTEYIKEKNNQNKDQEEQQAQQQNNMSSKYKTPAMPKIPNMKAPSMKMPKF
jgi:hypothetical protein|tara:strand:- start:419 stop:634 length:216 start_codon:yes stop_codon:yes gene_type:complete